MSTLTTAQLADLVEEAKIYLRIEDDDAIFQSDALAVYHDQSASATAATVQVESGVLSLVITGGANAGTDSLTLSDAANDTLTELVTVINALAKGWVATLLGRDSANSTLLLRKASTSAYGQSNEQTLVMENNQLLELIITNLLKGMETCLARDLLSTAFSELYDKPKDGCIVLRQPDVSLVGPIFDDYQDAFTAKYTGTDTHARVEVTDSSVKLISRVGSTTSTETIDYTTYPTIGQIVTQGNTVGGWTLTTVNNGPSAYLARRGGWKAKDTLVSVESWEETEAEYEIDYEAGVIRWLHEYYPIGGFGLADRVRVDYTAGPAALSADVKQALLEGVKAIWDASSRTAGLKSERLGDYSYTMAEIEQATSSAAIEAAGKLTAGHMRILA